MIQDLKAQKKYIAENFSKAKSLKFEAIKNDHLIIYVGKKDILEFLEFLRDDKDLSFKTLLDLFGADLLGIRTPRFEVIYNLLSYKLNNRITVKVALEDNEKLESATPVFSSAGWLEREAFDMYGIEFENHPDLRRILTDYNFEGFPLRKDFPLTGYEEVRYDEKQQKVVYEPVKLAQEFRKFDFEMPWEGPKLEAVQQSLNKDGEEKAN